MGMNNEAMVITNDAEYRRAFMKMNDLTNRILFTSNKAELVAIEDQLDVIAASIEAYEDEKNPGVAG